MPRHSYSHYAASPTEPLVDFISRHPLSGSEVQKLSLLLRDKFKWQNDPKEFQLDAIRAQLEGANMVIQAPTGAGKTAIAAGPHVWLDHRVTLMICPLLTLENEMVRTFKSDYGLSAVAINGENKACTDPAVIQAIFDMRHQIVLISPEMLLSQTFVDTFLRNRRFTRNVVSIFVDEAHCTVHWGADFRKEYGTLGKIRAFLPRDTPVMAVSATITPRVKRAIQTSLLFGQSSRQSRWKNEGNDRPNISIIVRALEYPLSSLLDIDFIVPDTITSPLDIPITQIFADDVELGSRVVDHLNERLCRILGASSDTLAVLDLDSYTLLECVRPFNAQLSQEYRTAAMPEFREGNIRILVCTEAAGMGSNNPKVIRTIQLKKPKKLSQVAQRFGRAVRGAGLRGVAIMLVERKWYNVDLVSANPKPKKDPKLTQIYAREHGVDRGSSTKEDTVPVGSQPTLDLDSDDEGLLVFIQSLTCRRQIIAEIFDSTVDSGKLTVPCCDICDPSLLDQARPSPPVKAEKQSRMPKKGTPDRAAQRKLIAWRSEVHQRDTPTSVLSPAAVLNSKTIEQLVSHGCLPAEKVSHMLRTQWTNWDLYGTELMAFLEKISL
ncbi:P-loop containing nucleoside triphosphate hydrolase protein, partial [Epithele typhae]|uniref:P-loop containing nucleoside triphosphate hydrolase protein n=1 Tax=Epithele typhae TaxID=378194 RepID=UPI002007EC73